MAAPSIPSISTPPTLPPFLKQSKSGTSPSPKTATLTSANTKTRTSELHNKFVDLEWQQRNRLLSGTQPAQSPADPASQFSRLPPDLVASRNRYMNVEPYAQNRIKLKVPDGSNDYINASPIQLGERKYIATQGPKDTSVNHFYRMLETEVGSPAVVVMLTQTHESGREKCYQYFPLDGEESPMAVPEDTETGDGWKAEVHLDSVEENEGSRSQIRRLRLRTRYDERAGEAEEGEAKEIEMVHLLFSGWPDFLIPEGDDRDALVELIKLSASLNRPPVSDEQSNGTNGTSHILSALSTSSNPRIIHCSAGVGRSGTFIALDYLLTQLHSGQLSAEALDPPDRDPIADTVDLLRQQRMMMVQGESQFVFLYDLLKDCYVQKMQGEDASGGAAVDGDGGKEEA